MLLGLAMIIAALLWARRIRQQASPPSAGYRGPWIMGLIGAAVFLFYLWLVSHGTGPA